HDLGDLRVLQRQLQVRAGRRPSRVPKRKSRGKAGFMSPARGRNVSVAALAALLASSSVHAQEARSCPAPLAEARRLVLVTAAGMKAATATMRLYERAEARE